MELPMEDRFFIGKDDLGQEDFLNKYLAPVPKLIETSYEYKSCCERICKRYGGNQCLCYPFSLKFWAKAYIYRRTLTSSFELSKEICKDIMSGKIPMWISYENDGLDIFSITAKEKSSDGSMYFTELLDDGSGRVLKRDTGEFLKHIIGPVISYKYLQQEGFSDSIILDAMNDPVYQAYRIIGDIHN